MVMNKESELCSSSSQNSSLLINIVTIMKSRLLLRDLALAIFWFHVLPIGNRVCAATSTAADCPADAHSSSVNSGTMFESMDDKVKNADGFFAALDQSGGSTPKALALYGILADTYEDGGPERMYDVVHGMRSRIITSPAFSGDKVIGAILFENTMDRDIEGIPTGRYLWEKKNIVPFLKCDNGLDEEMDGIQLMKPMPSLDELLIRAKSMGIYGTKMRSVIKFANPDGIRAIVKQQFDIGKQILGHGLVPIIEPEVDIHSPEKEACEEILKAEILEQLNALDDHQNIILKLTLPSKVNHYKDCVDHPNCKRVLALSGGYSREKANAILAQQTGMIGSFSRALSEGLNHSQTDETFDNVLAESISSIFEASKGG